MIMQSSLKKVKYTISANPRGSLGAATRQGKYGFVIPTDESKAYDFSELRGSLGGYPPMPFRDEGSRGEENRNSSPLVPSLFYFLGTKKVMKKENMGDKSPIYTPFWHQESNKKEKALIYAL